MKHWQRLKEVRVSSLHFVQRKAKVSPSSSLAFTLVLTIRTAMPGNDLR